MHRADGTRGTTAVLLRLDAAAGSALGIDFGHRHVRVAVADLSSAVLRRAVRRAGRRQRSRRGPRRRRLHAAPPGRSRGRPRPRDRRRHGALGPIDRHKGRRPRALARAGRHPGRRGARPEAREPGRAGQRRQPGRPRRGLVRRRARASDVLYLMMSAGIGAGLVFGGKLYHGATGITGELGHIQVRPEARRRCGNRGCLETVASTRSARRACALRMGRVNSGDARPRRRRDRARGAVNDAGRAVGRAAADLHFVNPARSSSAATSASWAARLSTPSARRSIATRCPEWPRRWRSGRVCSASAPDGPGALAIADTDRLRFPACSIGAGGSRRWRRFGDYSARTGSGGSLSASLEASPNISASAPPSSGHDSCPGSTPRAGPPRPCRRGSRRRLRPGRGSARRPGR